LHGDLAATLATVNDELSTRLQRLASMTKDDAGAEEEYAALSERVRALKEFGEMLAVVIAQ